VKVSQWTLSNNVLHADWLEMQLRFYEDSFRDVVDSGKAPTNSSKAERIFIKLNIVEFYERL
jgi:hypothetical protein